MALSQILHLATFVLATIYISIQAPISFATELPLHSSILILLVSGITIVACELWRPIYANEHQSHYVSIPMHEIDGDGEERGERNGRERSGSASASYGNQHLSIAKMRGLLLLLLGAVVSRVEVGRRVLNGIHCAGRSYEVFVPVALAFLDFLLVRKHERLEVNAENSGNKVIDFVRSTQHSKYRFIISSFILSLCGHLLSIPDSLRSSYICSPVDSAYRGAPFFQVLMAILEAIIFGVVSLFLDPGPRGLPLVGGKGPLYMGGIMIASAFLLLPIAGISLFFVRPTVELYVWSIVKLSLAACVFVGTGLRVVHHRRIMTAYVIVTFTNLYTSNFITTWKNRQPYPNLPNNYWLFLMTVVILAFGAFINGQHATVNKGKSVQSNSYLSPWRTPFLILILLVVRCVPWYLKEAATTTHPIEILIQAAETEHKKYAKAAMMGTQTLSDVTKEYHRRYGRPPPPGFDIWHEYAKNRSTLIYHDYNNIYDDLLPYWALSPQELRDRVWEAISQPDLYIGGISVRNGNAEIAGQPKPTHRWNLDGIIKMMEPFVQYLPDMDLAFNLNDEPRVVVSYDSLQSMKQKHTDSLPQMKTWDPKNQKAFSPHFSPGRAKTWRSANEKSTRPSRFHGDGFRQSFYNWGSVGCRPDSRARNERHWNPQVHCTDCAAPHRLGAWVKDWALAGDICHQPDLANLHGFFLSPAALDASHDLIPVFSQSKPYGFQDIRYPSPWNYVDKAKYGPDEKHPDVNWEEKEKTLFWRGQTSEGLSRKGEWKGMARQRLVSLATNTTNSQVVLSSSSPSTYRYKSLSPSTLHALVSTSVRFTPNIVRCVNSDCPNQEKHFGYGNPVDFQDHWRYAFLYDTDGAGFSGRFIPFLRSKSLPFKSALFREWWDRRLTAWVHFVPIDLRMAELWSTVAYFAGVGEDGKKAKARVAQGKVIAERGREWANKVIRKEDMEVYFFRLLLEWGRITDDARDTLGLVM